MTMSLSAAFGPQGVSTGIDVTTTSGSVQITTTANQLLITNEGTTICYVITGEDAATAIKPTGSPEASSMPVLGESAIVITRPA